MSKRAYAWLGFGMLMACSASFPEPRRDVLSSPSAIEAGRQTYVKNCVVCHGTSGYGDGPQAGSLRPPPADLRSLSGIRAEPGYWFFRIKEGGHKEPLARPGSAMPAWGDHLSDLEIWQVVAYMKGLGSVSR